MLLGVGIGENSKNKNYVESTLKDTLKPPSQILHCTILHVLSYGSCLIFFLYRRYFTVQNNQLMYQKRLKVWRMYVPVIPQTSAVVAEKLRVQCGSKARLSLCSESPLSQQVISLYTTCSMKHTWPWEVLQVMALNDSPVDHIKPQRIFFFLYFSISGCHQQKWCHQFYQWYFLMLLLKWKLHVLIFFCSCKVII